MVDCQFGVLPFRSGMSYEDGIFLSAQLVIQHFRIWVTDSQLLVAVINESIGSLSPFQNDIRAML